MLPGHPQKKRFEKCRAFYKPRKSDRLLGFINRLKPRRTNTAVKTRVTAAVSYLSTVVFMYRGKNTSNRRGFLSFYRGIYVPRFMKAPVLFENFSPWTDKNLKNAVKRYNWEPRLLSILAQKKNTKNGVFYV